MQGVLENSVVVWLSTTAVAGVAVFAGHAILFRVLCRMTRGRPLSFSVVEQARKPALALVGSFVLYVSAFGAPVSDSMRNVLRHVLALILIALIGWLSTRVAYLLMEAVVRRQEVELRDNLRARKVRTQLIMVRRLISVIIWILAGAAMLTTFTEVRALGASIFASAGVIGIVAGVAAQSTVGNLVAGIQIALTEPIRLDDVVIVEGEWGRIEEITLSFVVVGLWDKRRLVLPVSYFTQTPFQNWTRTGAELIGSVYVYTDYTVPVDEVRLEFDRILQASEHWDGNASALQVTDATESTVQLRAIMSARDAPTAWDLRCEVREKVVAFLQDRYPGSLPRVRADLFSELKPVVDRRNLSEAPGPARHGRVGQHEHG